MADTDETLVQQTVGERLRAAREDKGVSLEDVAAQTRIPRRHLESLETGDWDQLPAPTYTIGFAKSYAAALGLDRAEIGEQLRAEMGGTRASTADSEIYEAADPARVMPKWLVLTAIAAVILLVIGMSWYNRRALEEPKESAPPAQATAPGSTAAPSAVQQQPQQPAQGPVTLAASEPVWIQVQDQGRTLFQGTLSPGQNYQVPATAAAPRLKAGKPEALRVTVGTAVAPPVGPPGRVASNVSLLAADLMSGSTAQTSTPAPQPR